MKKIIFVTISSVVLTCILWYSTSTSSPREMSMPSRISKPTISPSPTPFVLPRSKVLQNDYHIFQTFNNCGPASLSMMLSYFGITQSQETLGEALRPYQVASGDNDDKSVTLAELEQKAKEYQLSTFHRPNGDIDLLKQFIAHDIPVLTRTWLHVDEDIGHYRVIKGYDETTQTIIQDDSYQGKNLSYSYTDFLRMWEKFDFEYVVMVPKEKEELAKNILNKNSDDTYAWTQALRRNEKILTTNPDDIYARFNVSVAHVHLGNYKEAITAFEQVQSVLPTRTLWYQIEPIQAYYELGAYDKLLTLTDAILENENRAYAELYILRGKSYVKQGNQAAAKEAFQKALLYNKNLPEAKDLTAKYF